MDWRRIATQVLTTVAKSRQRPAGPKGTAQRPTPTKPREGRGTEARPSGSCLSRGRLLDYSPDLDGAPDPGEVVWAWVPFEDDPSRGKDRPLLVVGRDGHQLFGLMLSSNADREGQRHWMHLGAGAWDAQQRPSWIRLDRVLDVQEKGVRREGAILDRARFDKVAAELRRSYGWK